MSRFVVTHARAQGKTATVRRKLEAELEAAVSDWLTLDQWRTLKTDPVSDRSTAGAISRALIAALPQHHETIRKTVAKMTRGKGFGEVGMNDRLYIRYEHRNPEKAIEMFPGMSEPMVRAEAQVLWIEFKSPTGKPTPEQLLWTAAERARGALCLIAGIDFPATFDGFRAWYKASGLNRRLR